MTTAHQHEATLEDALDFINTLHIEEDAPDHLAELGAGTEWLAQRGLLHERRDGRLPGVDDEGTNTRIRGCRDAMRALFDATVEGHRVSRDVLDELNRVLQHRELIELVPSRAGARLDHRHVGDPVDDALARLAEVLARDDLVDAAFDEQVGPLLEPVLVQETRVAVLQRADSIVGLARRAGHARPINPA